MDNFAGITAVLAIDKDNKIIDLKTEKDAFIEDPQTGEKMTLTHIRSVEQLATLIPVKVSFVRLNENNEQIEVGTFDFDEENYELLITGNSTQTNDPIKKEHNA